MSDHDRLRSERALVAAELARLGEAVPRGVELEPDFIEAAVDDVEALFAAATVVQSPTSQLSVWQRRRVWKQVTGARGRSAPTPARDLSAVPRRGGSAWVAVSAIAASGALALGLAGAPPKQDLRAREGLQALAQEAQANLARLEPDSSRPLAQRLAQEHAASLGQLDRARRPKGDLR